jgi:hypothetical protein
MRKPRATERCSGHDRYLFIEHGERRGQKIVETICHVCNIWLQRREPSACRLISGIHGCGNQVLTRTALIWGDLLPCLPPPGRADEWGHWKALWGVGSAEAGRGHPTHNGGRECDLSSKLAFHFFTRTVQVFSRCLQQRTLLSTFPEEATVEE